MPNLHRLAKTWERLTKRLTGSRLYYLAWLLYCAMLWIGDLVVVMVRLWGIATKSILWRPESRRCGRRVLFLTLNEILFDPRVNKTAFALAEAGYDVVILCPRAGHTFLPIEQAAPGVMYHRLALAPLPFNLHWFYQNAFLRHGLTERYDFVHANDLNTLPVAWMVARLQGIPLIYDSHEIMVENVYYNRKVRRYERMAPSRMMALCRLERRLVADVDLFISVSDPICEWFKKTYNLTEKPLSLPNFPEVSLLNEDGVLQPLRQRCGLNNDHFVILYLGGINPARNIEGVIKALPHLPDPCVFVIQGPEIQRLQGEYHRLAQDLGVPNRVFTLPPVMRHQVVKAMSDADCGVLMLKNLCLNFYYFYPNKFFEYMLAAIPVATSDFPSVAEHVARERCGITFDPEDPKSIAKALFWLYEHPEERKLMGERGRRSVLERCNWETAVKSLVEEYDKLLEKREQACSSDTACGAARDSAIPS